MSDSSLLSVESLFINLNELLCVLVSLIVADVASESSSPVCLCL